MPVRLLRPYNGQNANTLYVGTDEAILRAIGIADDYIENATNFVPFASQAFRAFASSFSTGSPAGSFITSFSNPFAGQGRGITTYTLTGTVPPQVALSATGRTLVVGSTAAVAGTIYSVNVTATSGDGLLTTQPATLSFMAVAQLPLVAGGGGTPAPTPTPTPTPSPTLNALTVSSGSGTVGSVLSSTISGLTSGSSLSLSGAGAPGLSISGAVINGTPTTAGTVNIVETLAGATNSPRTTSGVITVSAAAAVSTLTGLGDSILIGASTPSTVAFSAALLGYGSSVTVTNLAVSGQSLATNYNRIRVGELDAYYTESAPSVLFVEGGTNDFPQGTTGSALYAITTNLVTLAKAKGFYVIIQTIMKRRQGVLGWTTATETERQNYNTLVAANSAGADYVLDLTGDAYFGESSGYSDSSNSTTVDGLHASVASQQAWAPLIKAKTDLALARPIRYSPQIDLTVGARQVVAGAAFTTPVIGIHKSWTTTATSSDGATLTVSNGVLSGTFATSGSKTITFVETPPAGLGLSARTSSTIILATTQAMNYTRFVTFSSTPALAETADPDGGFDYTSTVAISGHNPSISGQAAVALPAGADGFFAIGDKGGQPAPFMGFTTSTNAGHFTTYTYAMFGDGAVGTNYSINGGPTTSTPTAIQAGDHRGMRRVGSTITAEVSRDGGLTWIVVATWTGASTARLAFGAQPSAIGPASTIKAPYVSTTFV